MMPHASWKRASESRIRQLPEAPTLAESGIGGCEASVWYGVVTAARRPAAIVERLNAEIVRIVETRTHRERMLAADFEPTRPSPAEFATFIRSEAGKWARVVKLSGARAD